LYLHSWGPKCRIAEQSCVNRMQVAKENSSERVRRYNIYSYTRYEEKLKHKNISRPKVTAGLSIKLSINVEGVDTHTYGDRRL